MTIDFKTVHHFLSWSGISVTDSDIPKNIGGLGVATIMCTTMDYGEDHRLKAPSTRINLYSYSVFLYGIVQSDPMKFIHGINDVYVLGATSPEYVHKSYLRLAMDWGIDYFTMRMGTDTVKHVIDGVRVTNFSMVLHGIKR